MRVQTRDYIHYVPTQVFTEAVREEMTDQAGAPVRGIRYRSAVDPTSFSWVLFVGPSGCVDLKFGWQQDPSAWLALEPSATHRFDHGWIKRPDSAPTVPET